MNIVYKIYGLDKDNIPYLVDLDEEIKGSRTYVKHDNKFETMQQAIVFMNEHNNIFSYVEEYTILPIITR